MSRGRRRNADHRRVTLGTGIVGGTTAARWGAGANKKARRLASDIKVYSMDTGELLRVEKKS